MTTPVTCLLVAFILPYVWATVSTYFRKREFKELDNHHPRLQSAKLVGPGARANGAQANAWEALTVFGPAVLLAHVGAPTSTLAPLLALGWVGVRVLHGVVYIADIPNARTGLFVLGSAASIGLLLVGAGVL